VCWIGTKQFRSMCFSNDVTPDWLSNTSSRLHDNEYHVIATTPLYCLKGLCDYMTCPILRIKWKQIARQKQDAILWLTDKWLLSTKYTQGGAIKYYHSFFGFQSPNPHRKIYFCAQFHRAHLLGSAHCTSTGNNMVSYS